MNKFCRFLSVALVIALAFTLTACGSPRVPITAAQFISAAENAGYQTIDGTDQFGDGAVDQVILAGNDNIKVEFYVLPTADQTKDAYAENKQMFESAKGSTSSNVSVALNNYGYYTQTSAGIFCAVAYIDNTMIYATVADTYRSEVNDFITSLGYLGKAR